MKFKIVSDSASNLFTLPGVEYCCVPLKIIAPTKEYVDTPDLDLDGMIEDLKTVKGPTGTSCPNVHEWSEAFEGAEHVFAVTISGNLSGSCSAAMNAAEGRDNVFVIDSLSAGPGMQLIVERLRDLILEGLEFEQIQAAIREYHTHTHIVFSLESLANLARNGRVSPAIAKIAGVLGLRLICIGSKHGTIEPVHKARGEKKALRVIFEQMKANGYHGGRAIISHCQNLPAAQAMEEIIRQEFPSAAIDINRCTALCSFYAEQGGLLVGFEDL